ncbi:hypothetical protein D3C87_280100 [compost metagenome]
MENKYLEKIAFLSTAIGAIGGAKASSKDDTKLGRAVSGAAAGTAVGLASDKVVTHGAKNFLKLVATNRARPAHLAALAAGTIGAGVAGSVGSYYAGKASGKMYDKAKEKVSGK